MKFKEWALLFLSHEKKKVKQHTYYTYQSIFSTHLNQEFGERNLSEITKKDIQAYLDQLSERGLKPSTVRLIYVVLKKCFDLALEEGKILNDLFQRILLPKKENKTIEVFTRNEQKQMEQEIYASEDTRLYGIIIDLYTGLRIGELLSLKWENVDMENSLIHVESTVYRCQIEKGKYQVIVDKPKTESSRRIIPFGSNVKDLLKILKKENSEYVISFHQEMILIRSYQNLFSSFLKKIDIKPRGFHALRHTYATRSLELGIDIKTLSELLGHKNASTTLNIYSHTLLETKRKAQNKLSGLSVKKQQK